MIEKKFIPRAPNHIIGRTLRNPRRSTFQDLSDARDFLHDYMADDKKRTPELFWLLGEIEVCMCVMAVSWEQLLKRMNDMKK